MAALQRRMQSAFEYIADLTVRLLKHIFSLHADNEMLQRTGDTFIGSKTKG